MSRVFVSYRREDTGAFAARLAARLRLDLRLENAFLDRAIIGLGERWRDVLDDELQSTDAVLVLVGAAWAGADGQRIHAADDMVAWELRRALALPRDLVPTMVDGARWPHELPPDLAVLRELNFIDLDPADSPLGYLELLGDLFYKSVRHHGDVIVVHDESDSAEVHVRELAARLTSGVPVKDAEQLVRAVTRGFAAISLGEAAARWPEVIVLVGEDGRTPALMARVRGLERNRLRAVFVPATAAGIIGFVAGRARAQTSDGPPQGGGEVTRQAEMTRQAEVAARTGVARDAWDDGGSESRWRTGGASGSGAGTKWIVVAGALLATLIVIGLGAGVAAGWVRWPPWSPSPSPSVSPSFLPSPSESRSPSTERPVRVRPRVTLANSTVTFAPPFRHRLAGRSRPDADLVYRSLSEDCTVTGDELTLAQTWPALPITCRVEVTAVASDTIEPGPPVTGEITITAPDLELVAPQRVTVTWPSDLPKTHSFEITVTESSEVAADLTAVTDSRSCRVGVTPREKPGTSSFRAVVTMDYPGANGSTCTVIWTARSAVGGADASAVTVISVRPPNVVAAPVPAR